ncbi:MAG: hypothetical protein F4239_05475 [Gammaproteobacteria bacterium]|nr:hypothetical protein [Gammaproteobacteria bacterium]
MKEQALLIRMDITEKDGWFVATSKDLDGFVLAHPSEEMLLDDLPSAIKMLIDARYDVNCKVVPSQFGKPKSKAKPPWLVIPAEVESIAIPAIAA